MEFIFENMIHDGSVSGSSARIMTGGNIISVSEDLKEIGCPTEDLDKALVWLARRRDLGIPKRNSFQTKAGNRVTLAFAKQVADTGKKVALPRFVTEKKNLVPVQ